MKTHTLAVVALLVLTASAGTAVAASDATAHADRPTKEVRIADEHVTVSDATITVSGTTVAGTGLSNGHVGNHRYTVDSTVSIDGLHVTHGDTRYTVCHVTVDVHDVGVHVTGATVSNGH